MPFEEPTIDIDLDDMVDMIETSIWGAIETVIDYGAECFWMMVPGHSSSIWTASMLPLILIMLMLLPLKVILDKMKK